MSYAGRIAAWGLLLSAAQVVASPSVPAFSRMSEGGAIDGWQALKPAPKARDTRYSLVAEAGRTVLRADADRYVMFDYPVARLPLPTRLKMKLAESVYGQKLPSAALNYVWDNRQPVGFIRPNVYTERARMIVARSGAAEANTWVTETRDLRADFLAAFGEQAPDVVAIAVATDTDNTGGKVQAWFGDLEFVPAENRKLR